MRLVDVLVGLQWGSEGKGKISAYLSSEYKVMVRSGGPQAGHTFYKNGLKYINRQVPCGALSSCSLYIAPAGIINVSVLKEEIGRYNLTPERLMVDLAASILTERHVEIERKSSLSKRLASTCEGVGAAQVDKIWRKAQLFGNFVNGTELEMYSGDTVYEIHSHLKQGHRVLLEGTQGFGLCLNHGEYPFVTTRDVTSSALLNEAGLSPKDHCKTIGVLRSYPIRVGGNSGPTNSAEINWEKIQKRSGSKNQIREFTTVTGRLRRVFEQDFETLNRAIMINKPDELALTFLDYINAEDYGKNNFKDISSKSQEYIMDLEERLQVPITLISTGPEEHHIVDRRSELIKNPLTPNLI